jgi:tetratricopeptide (TPR) repeat protein
MQRVEARRRVTGAALLLLATLASQASANTRSQQLYAKALVPYHLHRWEQAHVLLDDALAADPDDAVVAYYRGLTSAHLGFPDKAIIDIEHALSLRPDLQPAVLDLGILYFETGQYQTAQEWLQRAYRLPGNRFSAAFFLGLTKLRMGDPKGAQPLLAEAAKDPSLRQSALYYQALAMSRQGESAEARELMAQVQNGPPDSETTQIARQYLLAPPSAVAGGEEKPWSVYAQSGFGYDSNVVLAPNNVNLAPGETLHNCYTMRNGACVPLDTKGEQDGFFAVSFGGKYRLFTTTVGEGSLGYDFYQSVHFQTPSFDLQNHEIHLDLSSTPQGPLQFGLSGFYDFYLLDYASFYQQGRGVPWVTLFEGKVAATQTYYQIIGQDFLGSENSGNNPNLQPGYSVRNPFNPFRDAVNNAFGVRQFFLLGAADRYMSVGYQWDDNDPFSKNGTDFAYTDNIFDIRADFGLFDFARATVGYAIDLQDYEHPNSRTDFSRRRHDFDNQIVVRFARDFTAFLSADIAYYGVINHSNIPDFQYDRNIVEASVRVHF